MNMRDRWKEKKLWRQRTEAQRLAMARDVEGSERFISRRVSMFTNTPFTNSKAGGPSVAAAVASSSRARKVQITLPRISMEKSQ